ncbi:hypothetical protein GQX74_015322 [Glossina fuscipes]|nr:hypothetical protein GQX74_015322 [Glossina fuscipes]
MKRIALNFKLNIETGGCCGSTKKRTIVGGWAWAWWLVTDVQRLSLSVMTLNPMCENVETAQGVPLTVTGVAQCKIMKFFRSTLNQRLRLNWFSSFVFIMLITTQHNRTSIYQIKAGKIESFNSAFPNEAVKTPWKIFIAKSRNSSQHNANDGKECIHHNNTTHSSSYDKYEEADELLGTASEQFLGKSVNEIKQTILQTLEGHLRAILVAVIGSGNILSFSFKATRLCCSGSLLLNAVLFTYALHSNGNGMVNGGYCSRSQE